MNGRLTFLKKIITIESMNVMSLIDELKNNSYPGRGIVVGKSENEKSAVVAYWTMGRSEGSRNRIFVFDEKNDVIRTKAFDESLVAGDPTLIIYAALRTIGTKTIVTNGDQTDTIFDGLKNGLSFSESLKTRKYEHDEPHYTPRISSLIDIEGEKLNYLISILKSDRGNPNCTERFTFDYENPSAGDARFIHTYKRDSSPLESFSGEPKLVHISGDIETFSNTIWSSLNEANKVSLFVRYINIKTGNATTKIFNKNP